MRIVRVGQMRIIRWLVPIVLALSFVLAVTVLLWILKISISPRYLVFYYLFPTAIVAMFYGSVFAMFTAIAGAACAAFFLYEPVFTFFISDRLEVGEFVCFSIVALFGSKCTADCLAPE